MQEHNICGIPCKDDTTSTLNLTIIVTLNHTELQANFILSHQTPCSASTTELYCQRH